MGRERLPLFGGDRERGVGADRTLGSDYRALKRGGPGREPRHSKVTNERRAHWPGRADCRAPKVRQAHPHRQSGYPSLGILQVREHPARMGRNPATCETIKIKASKKIAFRAAKDLREAV
jgi:hypothetical protein